MAKKKKLLIFSPPFSGHLFILKKLVADLQNEYIIKVVITGWKNIEPDLKGIKSKSVILNGSVLKETDPALWTFKRVYELYGDCLKVAKEFQPDLIIYDFFSIEGYFVGKALNIPHWSSIPAMLGRFSNRDYLKKKLSAPINKTYIKKITERYKISVPVKDFELISDGIHISGTANLIWSYEDVSPKTYFFHRAKSKYFFVGNPRGEVRHSSRKPARPLVYFSFGTVVLNNLWNQQAATRKQLKHFFSSLATMWSDEPFDVLLVSQGKSLIKNVPKNWKIVDRADQVKELSKASLFITHGGSNGFHESIAQGVPMVVIPFFGDQLLVGRQTQKLKIGINLGKGKDIDTAKSKNFLTTDLAKKLDTAVREVLSNPEYSNNVNKLNLSKILVADLIKKLIS